jgi:cytochrome bd-type quinol oxidase subunit 1
MFLANAWLTFMMSPAGVDSAGVFGGDAWAAMHNHLWNPINLHRVIANVAYGGSIVGAYAAYKFLSASSKEEKAHYDWMGYTANFIAISALLPLPFAGYYLAAEIYAYSQQMGITLMGGIFAWLFIIQAVLIGTC